MSETSATTQPTSLFQHFSTSKYGIQTAIGLARGLSLMGTARLARRVAKTLVAYRDSPLVQAIRLNQWVIGGRQAQAEALDQAACEVLLHAGRCMADLYRYMRDPKSLQALSPPSPDSERLIAHSQRRQGGIFLIAAHMSNFDVVLLANAWRGLRAQVLTYAHPTSGYQIQNQIRAQTGLDITPINETALKKAVHTLSTGSMVITAVDRPSRHQAAEVQFFGHKSPLSWRYIRLAMQTRARVVVASAFGRADGTYGLWLTEPFETVGDPANEAHVRANAETVLEIIARRVRTIPTQWLMYYPVWPQFLSQVPGAPK
ncbi:MAG: hypothetical protein Fur0018_12120 [Anaerolineales bacterium]